MRTPFLGFVRRSLVATLAATSVLGAQDAAPMRQVRGLAYDSLNSRGLGGALITIEALGRAAIADSAGAFVIDSVPEGRHELVLQHDLLDSLGLPEPRIAIDVPGDYRPVRLATPSFATLWRAACGARIPVDSGFVHGVVRDARKLDPVAGADIQASWLVTGADTAMVGTRQRMGGSVTTDANGRYAVCGVPNGVSLLVRARLGEARSDNLDLVHDAPGVTRRDFLLPSVTDAALLGVIRGVVRGSEGGPVPNATVEWPGLRDARTDALGRFTISNIPIGTRSLTVRAVGADPMASITDVPWGDTTRVAITLAGVRGNAAPRAVTTAAVSSGAPPSGATVAPVEITDRMRRFLAELDERKAVGVAKFMDSTRVSRFSGIHAAVTAASNARVTRNGALTFGPRPCHPAVWIDATIVAPEEVGRELRLLSQFDVGVLEIYEFKAMIPPRFWVPGTTTMPECAVVIWTKRNFP